MKVHYLITGIFIVLLTAGCIQPGSHDSYEPADTITEFPPDNAPSRRDIFFYTFSRGDNPANYTSFCPPSYVPADYSPYDLNIYTVWNETEPGDHRTTVCERLRYVLNITLHASWTPDMTLLEVSWSEYGFDPYENEKNDILDEEPEKVDVGRYDGLLYGTEDPRLIVWTAGNATYRVYGSLDRGELLRVARSITCE